MIVVSNTSPLTNLAAIGQFALLRDVFAQISIPVGVWNELNAKGQKWPGQDDVASADWVQRIEVTDQALVLGLRRDLDRGEAESIALALQLRADLIILDEADGRHAAQRFGLHITGTIGVLLAAKSAGAINAVRPHLDALREQAGFYISGKVYQASLHLAGES